MIHNQIRDKIKPKVEEYGVNAMARQIGRSGAHVSRWLSGQYQMSDYDLLRVLTVLNLKLEIKWKLKKL